MRATGRRGKKRGLVTVELVERSNRSPLNWKMRRRRNLQERLHQEPFEGSCLQNAKGGGGDETANRRSAAPRTSSRWETLLEQFERHRCDQALPGQR